MHWLPSLATALVIVTVIERGDGVYGQQPPAAPQAVNEAQALWQRARVAVNEHASVQAKLIQDISLYDQHLMGSGTYLQGPPRYHWVSLNLAIKSEPYDTILQQRCDGEFLWILRSADGLTSVGKIDVRRVLAAAQASRAGTPVPMLGIGGVPKLFEAMQNAFRFVEARQEKLEGQATFVLRGEWRPDRLARWLPEQKDAIQAGQPPDLTKLPGAIPDHVLLYLDGGNLFPRRIDYRRRESSGGRPAGGSKSLVLVRFSDLVFDAPVDRRDFHYEPGLLPVTDETDQHIRSLGLAP